MPLAEYAGAPRGWHVWVASHSDLDTSEDDAAALEGRLLLREVSHLGGRDEPRLDDGGEHVRVHCHGGGGGDAGPHHVRGGHTATQLPGVGSVDHFLLENTWQGDRGSCVGHSSSGCRRGTKMSRSSHSGDKRLEA